LFNLLADTNTYPTVIHCTQGKDRTGLIIFLLLLLTQIVPPSAIATDYLRSDPELEPDSAERIAEMRAVGLDETYAKCADGFVEQMMGHVDGKYGGVERFLMNVVGVERNTILRIREQLVAMQR
jgi:protein-tyrosine phosphatase